MRTPPWNPKSPRVPVDANGNWIAYPSWDHSGWEDVPRPFYAVLEIDGMQTGRSAKRVILRNTETGKTYPMFVADMVQGIKEGNFQVVREAGRETGSLIGWWTGAKRGANYGIKAAKR